MLIITILAISLAITVILLVVGQYIYYELYPNNRIDRIINNQNLRNLLAKGGLDGAAGAHGNTGDFAVHGLDGADGCPGATGYHGEKVLRPGRKGVRGPSGSQGLFGCSGFDGPQGLPSNSIVPYHISAPKNTLDIAVSNYSQCFTYDNTVYKLSISFLFEDISYFSFQNGIGNKRYKIDTTGTPPWQNLTINNPDDTRARRVYSSVRPLVEKKETSSDGTIIFAGAPVVKNSFLVTTDVNLNDQINLFTNLEELTIEEHRDFGLDFQIVENTGGIVYNFLIGGILRYRSVFNLDPPNADLVPRFEERFSKDPIADYRVPVLDVQAKGNVKKISDPLTTVPKDNIYLMSPRLEFGRVVYRSATNPKNIWVVTPDRQLGNTFNGDLPPIVQAFQSLGFAANTFREDPAFTKNVLVFNSYLSPDRPDNLNIGIKKPSPGSSSELQALHSALGAEEIARNDFEVSKTTLATTLEDFCATPPTATAMDVDSAQADVISKQDLLFTAVLNRLVAEYNYSISSSSNTENFTTGFILNNLSIGYPSDNIPLSYPSELENALLYLNFHIKVPIENIYDFIFHVYVGGSNQPHIVKNDSLVILKSINADGYYNPFFVWYEDGFLYYNIIIKDITQLQFYKFFGKRISLNFSQTTNQIKARYGDDNAIIDPQNPPPSTRFPGGWGLVNAFNPDYDFGGSVYGWDLDIKATKFTVEKDIFEVGYKFPNSSNIYSTLVSGSPQGNGDYYIDIPPAGYFIQSII